MAFQTQAILEQIWTDSDPQKEMDKVGTLPETLGKGQKDPVAHMFRDRGQGGICRHSNTMAMSLTLKNSSMALPRVARE